MSELEHDGATDCRTQQEAVHRADLILRARKLAGRYRSGVSDLAENHDRHLDEAFDRGKP